MEIFAIIAVLALGILGFIAFSRAKLAGMRAIALSKYAAQFDLNDSVSLHDWAISCLVYSQHFPWGRGCLSEADYFNLHLEIAVALRDRVDELVGRLHGYNNKVAIRAKLALATASLSKQTPFSDVLDLKRQFSLDENGQTEGTDWLEMHFEILKRAYLQPI
jgi:hypothetical protein